MPVLRPGNLAWSVTIFRTATVLCAACRQGILADRSGAFSGRSLIEETTGAVNVSRCRLSCPACPVPGPRHPRDRGVHFLVDRHEIIPASSRMPTLNRSSRYALKGGAGALRKPVQGQTTATTGPCNLAGTPPDPSSELVPAVRMTPEQERPQSLWIQREVRSRQCRVWLWTMPHHPFAMMGSVR